MVNSCTPLVRGQPSSPLDLNPLQFGYGLFLMDQWIFNGINGFSWFADEMRALAYLRNDVWTDIGYSAADDIPERALFRAELSGLQELSETVIDTLNNAQELVQIQWAGQFSDMFNGTDTFTRGFVEDFHELRGSGKIQHTKSEAEDFVAYLRSYSWERREKRASL
jgi:hypothetical protein